MTHLHFNPVGGLAGDMFCAALLDLRPAMLDELHQLLALLQPPPGLAVELTPAPGPLHGRRFEVLLPEVPHQDHHHTHYNEIRTLLDQAGLPVGVRDRAQAIFLKLARAEARVHGTELERVAFHEVGNWDSIVDIVAAAFLLERLQVTSCSCDPLPRGGGRVYTQHGWLPVPAPATAYLLEGLPLWDDGVGGERITPTGAAILRSLQPGHMPKGRLIASGYGFGNRELEGIPNCLQAQLLETDKGEGYRPDQVLEIAFELDDQTPEDLAIGLDKLREQPGVLSVLQLEGSSKQGRSTQQIQILTQRSEKQAVIDACFRETRTLGLRYRQTERWTLERRQLQVELPEGPIGVKLSRGPGGWQAKAEDRDLRRFSGHQERRRIARLAEAAALQQNQAHDRDD